MEFGKGDEMYIITIQDYIRMCQKHPTKHKNMPPLLLDTLTLSLVGFEEASCHETYSQKEMNCSTNNLKELRSGAFPGRASDENSPLTDTLFTACETQSRVPDKPGPNS